ncbi:MAG: GNAT family N-acetyltransferase [Clostridia bacterium]|nr:GNAT family N-acetyltransferase [Clostridia bacterium]
MKINFVSKIFSKMPAMETERLVLRAIKRCDVVDMFEYSSNPKTCQYLLWNVHKTPKYTQDYIDLIISKYKSGDYNDWALIYKENQKMIGTCGFTRIDKENSVVEIGYVINPDYWGMGIATEAASKVISFAFEELKVNRVEAKFLFGNSASLAVTKKIGMKFEGYQREAMFVKGKFKTIGISSILRREYLFDKKYENE